MRHLVLSLICLCSLAAATPTFDPITVGSPMPGAALSDADGQAIDLATALSGQPTVLIVYRGGWCPFCNAHLGQVATVVDTLRESGARVVALSPDSPERIAAARSAGKLDERITVWSDAAAHAIDALGLSFTVDAATLAKYQEYGIDLSAASGHDHHKLPVPAVLVVDGAGVLRFIHADPDYQRRLDPQVVVAVTRSLLAP